MYGLTGEVAVAMTGGNGGGSTAMVAPIILPEGVISILSASDGGSGGALFATEVWYIPLDVVATIVAV